MLTAREIREAQRHQDQYSRRFHPDAPAALHSNQNYARFINPQTRMVVYREREPRYGLPTDWPHDEKTGVIYELSPGQHLFQKLKVDTQATLM